MAEVGEEPMYEGKFWNEKIETLPLEEIRKIQFKKLKKQMKYIYEKSEFYKKKFVDLGIKPEDIKNFDDFRNLPIFVTKEEHRESQNESLSRFGHPFGTYREGT